MNHDHPAPTGNATATHRMATYVIIATGRRKYSGLDSMRATPDSKARYHPNPQCYDSSGTSTAITTGCRCRLVKPSFEVATRTEMRRRPVRERAY